MPTSQTNPFPNLLHPHQRPMCGEIRTQTFHPKKGQRNHQPTASSRVTATTPKSGQTAAQAALCWPAVGASPPPPPVCPVQGFFKTKVVQFPQLYGKDWCPPPRRWGGIATPTTTPRKEKFLQEKIHQKKSAPPEIQEAPPTTHVALGISTQPWVSPDPCHQTPPPSSAESGLGVGMNWYRRVSHYFWPA